MSFLKYALTMLLLFFGIYFCPAQDTTLIKAKAKIVDTMRPPGRNLANSAFGYYFLLDSFSVRKDSVHAGEYLQQVDPYYMMYKGCTPATLDTFLSRFYLTIDAKAEYKKHFEEIYMLPLSPAYDSFKAMRKQTLLLKHSLDTSKFLKIWFAEQLHITDSMHFIYLYQYVTKNGWPSLADGSLYAADIARRDIMHVYDYVIQMEKAFQTGQLPLLMWMKTWDNTYYFTQNYRINATLKGSYDKFDISSVLDGAMPSNVKDILDKVRGNCPVKDMFVIIETNTAPTAAAFFSKRNFGKVFSDILFKFTDDLGKACPPKNSEGHGMPQLLMPTDYRRDRMLLYVAYEK